MVIELYDHGYRISLQFSCLSDLVLSFCSGVYSLLTVTPMDTNATVGSQVRLSSSTDGRTEVSWQYEGESVTEIGLYIASEGFVTRLYMFIMFIQKHK